MSLQCGFWCGVRERNENGWADLPQRGGHGTNSSRHPYAPPQPLVPYLIFFNWIIKWQGRLWLTILLGLHRIFPHSVRARTAMGLRLLESTIRRNNHITVDRAMCDPYLMIVN